MLSGIAELGNGEYPIENVPMSMPTQIGDFLIVRFDDYPRALPSGNLI